MVIFHSYVKLPDGNPSHFLCKSAGAMPWEKPAGSPGSPWPRRRGNGILLRALKMNTIEVLDLSGSTGRRQVGVGSGCMRKPHVFNIWNDIHRYIYIYTYIYNIYKDMDIWIMWIMWNMWFWFSFDMIWFMVRDRSDGFPWLFGMNQIEILDALDVLSRFMMFLNSQVDLFMV